MSQPGTGVSVALFTKSLEQPDMQMRIRQSLPTGVSMDRFVRTTITAIQNAPAAIEGCDRMSLYNAVLRAASDGLIPDGREGAFVGFNTAKGKMIQWMPMIGGLIKKLGEVGISLDAQIVCENDVFDVSFGDDSKIVHKPAKLGQPRGKLIGSYAIAKLPNGTVMREVMDRGQLEDVRAVSRASESGPWVNFYDEMCRKTVSRRLIKRVPINDDKIAEVIRRDEELYALPGKTEPEVEAAPDPTPAEAPRPASLQALLDKEQAPAAHSGYTGDDADQHDIA